MAEALGVASSIIAILDLATKVVTYLNDVRTASKDMQRMMVEVSSTRGLLGTIRDLADVDEAWVQTIKILDERPNGPLEQAHNLLEDLARKLTPLHGLRKMGKAVMWPFKKDQVHGILGTLQRMNGIFSLALQSDHIELSRAIKGELVDIKRYVIDLHQSNQDAQQSAILRWLSSNDPTVNHVAACSRHEPGTGNWLLESDVFRRWLDAESHFLWIQGIAGSGKTVLCSTLIETIQTWRSSTNALDVSLGYFYFDFNDEGKQSALNALRSIVAQLSTPYASTGDRTLPSCIQELHAECKNRNQQPTSEQLITAVQTLAMERDRIFIIMDALDECSEQEELLAMILNLTEMIKTPISILVTSRKEHDIEEAFRSVPGDAVYVDSEVIEADIRLYISRRLTTDARLRTRSSDIRKEIEGALVERAQGMFRWVACQLDALRSCLNAASLRKALKSLPKTLDEIYDRILSKIDENYQEQALIALQWLTFSARPLTLGEIAEAVAVKPGYSDESLDLEDHRLFAPQDILLVCSSLVTYSVKSQEIRLAHHSVKEYLISERIRQKLTAKGFSISETLANRTIAEACLRYLLSFDSTDSFAVSESEEFPLTLYAAKYWPVHVRSIQEDQTATGVTELCMRFFRSQPNQKSTPLAFQNWLRIARPDRPWSDSSSQVETSNESGSPLYYASFYGLAKAATLLLDEGADANSKGLYGPCLHTAIVKGYPEVITVLIQHGADVNAKHLGWTPLHRAAQTGSESVMRTLLAAGPDLDALDESGGTALHRAANQGHEGLVKQLLEKGANIHIQNAAGQTPLRIATATSRLGVMQALVMSGADVMERTSKDWTLLHGVGKADLAKVLIDLGVPVDVKDIVGHTPLHIACRFANAEVVRLLLKSGADGNAQTKRKEVPMHFASVDQGTTVAGILIEHGVDINVQSYLGKTPLDHAMGYWNTVEDTYIKRKAEMIEFLKKHGAKRGNALQINVVPSTIQMINAVRSNSLEEVEKLLDTGIDINAQLHDGSTALHEAARRTSTAMTKLLLQKGASTFILDGEGHDPLIIAILWGRHDNVLLLLQHGADANFICSHNHTALYIASRQNMLPSVKHLLAHAADPNLPLPTGRSALHVASWEARYQAVQLLIDAGALVNARDDDCATPLLEVVCFRGENRNKADYVETARRLIEHGADIEAQQAAGWTVLGRAAFNGHEGLVRLILEYGADPGAQLPDGKSLVDLATDEGHEGVLTLLRRISFKT